MLNTDVENSTEKTVGKKTREELGNLSVIFWQDQYFVENNEAESSLVEENKYRNYYRGFTELRFPYYAKYGNREYLESLMNTYSTSGSIKSASYGQPFDSNKFRYFVWSEYYIHFTANITDITETYPDLMLVLEFYVDVKLYQEEADRKEEILLRHLDWNAKWLDWWQREKQTSETLTQTGNVSVIRKYDTKMKLKGYQ